MTDLTPLEARVLGCLMEKALSTPDVYPLSVNALTNACNQASNRLPVLAVADGEAEGAAESLVDLGLAERWPGRAMKYAHLAKQRWMLSEQELAVLAELLLRGPQTPGELRTNSRRMYTFADLAEVEAALEALLAAEPPLIVRLSKAPGAREARVAHLLSGPVAEAAPLPISAVSAPRPDLAAEVATLRSELAELHTGHAALRAEFEAFKAQF